jgi:hypothetical protein
MASDPNIAIFQITLRRHRAQSATRISGLHKRRYPAALGAVGFLRHMLSTFVSKMPTSDQNAGRLLTVLMKCRRRLSCAQCLPQDETVGRRIAASVCRSCRLLDHNLAYHFRGRWSRLGSSGLIPGAAHLHTILDYYATVF